MDYFIADTHFGHANILSLCKRPFSSIEEMDEAIINAWNRKVKKKADVVYVVGDLVWEKGDAIKYLSRLNGKKILITGNHDAKWLKKIDGEKYFEKITPFIEIRCGNHDVTLCHYPMLEWKGCRKIGSKKLGYHIHGHVHNRYAERYKSLYTTPHCLNAGVDINGFAPVSFEELVKNNEIYKVSTLPSLVDKAEFLAFKYHLYQTDKSGKPYIEHPRAVAGGVEGEEQKITAFLHDIVEDTDIELDYLRSIFPEIIIEAVLSMTHREGEEYFEYVRRVSENAISKQVKIADLLHNMDLSRLKVVTERDIERVEKYKKALSILKGE